jgi:hypothetical protein
MKIAFRGVRGGAPLAGLFCGHYCGYRREKLWASKKPTVLEAHGMGLTIKEVDNAKPNGKPYRNIPHFAHRLQQVILQLSQHQSKQYDNDDRPNL